MTFTEDEIKQFEKDFKSEDGKLTAYVRGWLLMPNEVKNWIKSHDKRLLERVEEEINQRSVKIVDVQNLCARLKEIGGEK